MDNITNERLNALDEKKHTSTASSLRKRWLLRAKAFGAQYIEFQSSGSIVDTCAPASHQWNRLKDIVNSSGGLDEFVVAIVLYQSRPEQHLSEYDVEMELVANLVSRHAYKLIHEQYDYALHRFFYSYYEALPVILFMKHKKEGNNSLNEPSIEYSIHKQNWQCSCLFMRTRLLPCRHIFSSGKIWRGTLLTAKLINKRWLLSALKHNESDIPPAATPFRVESLVSGRTSQPWDRKYREAQTTTNEICSSMSELAMREYKYAKGFGMRGNSFEAKRFDEIVR
ncbi:hypothetical protein PHMEG_00020415 [Phytophthora megakarya]|uniref:SWIM-type domain-containing protein n=1 Tax=Phytophthora megakarya TaxID=4795 RepID=A0A225VPF3_9STRA|nr:hypothetical protein PHMEG_00020415 [Phytophthora megakarya]